MAAGSYSAGSYGWWVALADSVLCLWLQLVVFFKCCSCVGELCFYEYFVFQRSNVIGWLSYLGVLLGDDCCACVSV